TYAAHAGFLRDRGEPDGARALLERGAGLAADLEQLAGASRPALEAIVGFHALRAALASECDRPGVAFAALNDACRAATALGAIDADAGRDRALRDTVGEAALRALCCLDGADADAAPIGERLHRLAQRRDVLPCE